MAVGIKWKAIFLSISWFFFQLSSLFSQQFDFQYSQMHKQPRLNDCGVSHERQYSFLQTDEIFFQFLTTCFTAMWLTQLLSFGDVLARSHKNNACHLGLCWHGRARIHPNIGVSKNAICTICHGWMAAGYQRKGNIVFYQLTKYLSI